MQGAKAAKAAKESKVAELDNFAELKVAEAKELPGAGAARSASSKVTASYPLLMNIELHFLRSENFVDSAFLIFIVIIMILVSLFIIIFIGHNYNYYYCYYKHHSCIIK